MRDKIFKAVSYVVLFTSFTMIGYLTRSITHLEQSSVLFFIVIMVLFVYIAGFITTQIYTNNIRVDKSSPNSQLSNQNSDNAKHINQLTGFMTRLDSIVSKVDEISYQHQSIQRKLNSISMNCATDLVNNTNQSLEPVPTPDLQSIVMVNSNDFDKEVQQATQNISKNITSIQKDINAYVNKLKGNAFESHMLRLLSDYHDQLTAWRGDKCLNYNGTNIYPKSNHYPDLEFEYTFDTGETIALAIECKWRQKWDANNQIKICDEQWQFKAYSTYNIDPPNEPRRAVFLALGVGGLPSSPDELYLVRLYKNRFYNDSPRLFHLLTKEKLMEEIHSNLSASIVTGIVAKLRFEIDNNYPRIVADQTP